MLSTRERGAERSGKGGRNEGQLAVALVDPFPVVRAGLALLIDACPDMDVVVEAGSADEALEALGRIRHRTVVVLVGLGLDGGERDAYWLIRTIRERHPGIAVLGCGARAGVMSISRALFVGADGYVDENADPHEFLQALRDSARGEMVLVGPPSEWVRKIAQGLERRGEAEARLTGREHQVLTMAAEGLTAREIGERLGVRERTVTTHLGRIYSKLGVGTRVGAVRAATASGLVSVSMFD